MVESPLWCQWLDTIIGYSFFKCALWDRVKSPKAQCSFTGFSGRLPGVTPVTGPTDNPLLTTWAFPAWLCCGAQGAVLTGERFPAACSGRHRELCSSCRKPGRLWMASVTCRASPGESPLCCPCSWAEGEQWPSHTLLKPQPPKQAPAPGLQFSSTGETQTW